MQTDRVLSTTHLYHYLFNPTPDVYESILEQGLRPLSDFPESERWQQIQQALPGVFEMLYQLFAEPVIHQPYCNSGIFVSPIDFRQIPDSFMAAKPRFSLPVERFDPAWSALSYEYEGQRVSLPLSPHTLEDTAALWTRDWVQRWFGVDQRRLFFYVPQVVTYQPGGIRVEASDYEEQ